jgi:hypothetical protein
LDGLLELFPYLFQTKLNFLSHNRNSQFSYSIAGGNLDNKFSVDPSSGVIVVEKSLDREDVDFYNLTVRAVDNGAPPAIGETLVKILP